MGILCESGGEVKPAKRMILRIPKPLTGLCSALLVLLLTISSQASLEVHFIDVGQADAILIQCDESSSNMLIDSGDRFKASRDKLMDYLEEQGMKHLDIIVATHPHADHIGGFPRLFAEVPVGQVYDSGYEHDSQLHNDYIALINDLEIPFGVLRRGDEITLGELVFHVLHPDEAGFDQYDINNVSIVLRLVYGDVSFLFSGDAEKEAESSMLSEELELEATILKVGHHGSRTSSTPSFIEAVNPEVAIIMVEEGNKYGLPDEEAIEALEAIGATVYRTDIDGTIVVWTDGWQYQVTTEWTGGCWPPPTFVDEASTASESEVISH